MTPHQQQHQRKQQQAQQQSSANNKAKQRRRRLAQNVGLTMTLLLIQLVIYRGTMPKGNNDDDHVRALRAVSPHSSNAKEDAVGSFHEQQLASINSTASSSLLPDGFQAILDRAKKHQEFCSNQARSNHSLTVDATKGNAKNINNENITAQLPAHGILQALASWKQSSSASASSSSSSEWQCQLPPETECQEQQVTAIYMAYKPDKLKLMVSDIQHKLDNIAWQALIKEIILVYNGQRETLTEHALGQKLQELVVQYPTQFRIFYALEEGLTNNLMNRYYPKLNVTTKAVVYYDDDGPFSYPDATLAAFELWKRNANAQVGALGRMFELSARQKAERHHQQRQAQQSDYDKQFVPHCPATTTTTTSVDDGDSLKYDLYRLPMFGAHMVLPSSSLLHVNYFCFLWHPALSEVRQFVLSHPVFPDDITVSLVVSQLSGRAPRTVPYLLRARTSNTSNTTEASSDSQQTAAAATTATAAKSQRRRRLLQKHHKRKNNNKNAPLSNEERRRRRRRCRRRHNCRRRLEEDGEHEEWNQEEEDNENTAEAASLDQQYQHRRRRLLWADVSRNLWEGRRSQAATQLAGYFGSISTGSVGWCWGSSYQKGMDTCVPKEPELGMLPWMNEDHTSKSTCP